MTRRRTARYGGALVLVGAAVVVGVLASGQAATTGPESTRSAPVRQLPLGDETPVPQVTTTPSPAPESTPGPPASAGPPAPGVRTSTEVEAAPPAVDATPPKPRPASLMPDGAPPSASELGKLVSGFPAVVPIVDDSTILSSSVDSNGDIAQATLVARTSHSADDVFAQYQAAFTALGLPGSTIQSASGDRAVAFVRDGSSVTLTVSDFGTDSTYSLFAVIALTP